MKHSYQEIRVRSNHIYLKLRSLITVLSISKLGNLTPNYSVLNPKTPRAEEAALELACQWNDIDTVVICGHSDCKVDINLKIFLKKNKTNFLFVSKKAMNLVYRNISQPIDEKPENENESLLKTWLMSNSLSFKKSLLCSY